MNKRLVVGALALVALVALVVLLLVPATFWMTLFLRPRHDFDPARLSPAPDYTSDAAWAALPTRDDLADLVPRGVEPTSDPRPADAFYVHPTTYYAADEWNAPLDEGRANEMRDLTIANEASTFNACCRVYAPVYRQVSLGAYFDVDENNQAAFRVAYADVAAAFSHYLTHFNEGRPFIIAAHSQGTHHALRLLGELSGTDAADRMVAAYLVGARATRASLGAVPPCEGPRDTGCAVAWDTFAEDFEPAPDFTFLLWEGDRMVVNDAGSWLCTNPISWSLGGQADASRHLGAVLLELNLPLTSFSDVVLADEPLGMEVTGLGAPEPQTVSARCVGGRLLVPRRSDRFRADFEANTGSYHLFDYDLFYMDIRKNAVERVEAYLAARAPISE